MSETGASADPTIGRPRGFGFVGFRQNLLGAGVAAAILCFLLCAFVCWGLTPAHSQLDPTPEAPDFECLVPSSVDVQTLRAQEVQDLESQRTAYFAELDQQLQRAWTAAQAECDSQSGWKYDKDTGLGTCDVLAHMALTRQCEQAKSSYDYSFDQAVNDVNEYYDLLLVIQTEESDYLEMISRITDRYGHIANVDGINDMLPTMERYWGDLRTLRGVMSVASEDELPNEKTTREQTIAHIDEQTSRVKSLQDEYLKHEEFKGEKVIVQIWDVTCHRTPKTSQRGTG